MDDRAGIYDFDIPETSGIPGGTQNVAVQEAEIRQGAKAPYIAITFNIRNGDWKDTFLYHNLTLSPNPMARVRTKKALEALLGRTLGKEDVRRLVSELKGRFARVTLTSREWEGELRPDVQRILPASGAFESGAAPGGNSGSVDDLFGSDDPESDIPF